MTASTTYAGVVRAVERASRRATDASALHEEAVRVIAAALPVDAWCALTLDPATVLPTGGRHEEGLPPDRLPRLLDLEHDTDEPQTVRAVARSTVPAAVLGPADEERSARWREVLAPSGLPHELRVVLRTEEQAWGAVVLMRAADRPAFSADEVALGTALSEPLARGTRRALALATVQAAVDGADGPGLVLLQQTGEDVRTLHVSDAARRWLDDVEDGTAPDSGLPLAVRSLAGSPDGGRLRLRTRAGRWLTLRTERTGEGLVAVLVAPSGPPEVAALLADAHGLTRRECEVVLLVARGHSTADIARLLWLSPHTVVDHLKKVFDKLGVGSRGEMTSRLFVDHYLPRTTEGDEGGWDGWFVGRGAARAG